MNDLYRLLVLAMCAVRRDIMRGACASQQLACALRRPWQWVAAAVTAIAKIPDPWSTMRYDFGSTLARLAYTA